MSCVVYLYPSWVLCMRNGNNLHISLTHGVCFSVFAMNYLFYELQNTKNHSIQCSGWSDTPYDCSKSRVHAAADQVWAL